MMWLPRFVLCACAAIMLAAASVTEPPAVTIDRETHVSQTDPALKMGETVLAAHPSDPDRLVGAAMAWLNGVSRRAVLTYASRDGGRSWSKTLSTAETFYDAADEALAFAADGTLYLVMLATEKRGDRLSMILYRSDDAGLSWTLASRTLPTITYDRPFMTVARNGTVFIDFHGVLTRSDSTSLFGPAIFASSDRGHTLNLLGIEPSTPPAYVSANGNLVAMPDGVVLSVFGEANDINDLEHPLDPGWYRFPDRFIGSVKIMRLTTRPRLEPFVTIATAVHPMTPTEGSGPMIAVDTTNGLFNERVYVIWPDRQTGRCRIRAAFSTDNGTTWSTPRSVDDVAGEAALQREPNNFRPMIAVNRESVAGAAWYDRRDDRANLGWHIRFAASRDGGETWDASVPVSSRPNTFDADGFFSTSSYGPSIRVNVDDRQLDAGDTAGFAASADGSFHAFWIDNRTGVPQVWSARIRVVSPATRHGSPDLDALHDVSADTTVTLEEGSYRGGIVRAAITVTNSSTRVLAAPAKLRVIVAESAVGTPEFVGAGNKKTGPGAVWDLAPFLTNGRLEPGSASKPLTIECRLTSRKPIVEGLLVRTGLLRLEAKVFATLP